MALDALVRYARRRRQQQQRLAELEAAGVRIIRPGRALVGAPCQADWHWTKTADDTAAACPVCLEHWKVRPKAMEVFPGKKTYLAGAGLIAWAIGGLLLGQLDPVQAGPVLLQGLGLIGLRMGVAKLGN